MREKIEKRIRGLWDKIYFELGRFENQYEALKMHLDEKKLGSAMFSVAFALAYLRVISETLDAIGVLEGLLEDEHEKKR